MRQTSCRRLGTASSSSWRAATWTRAFCSRCWGPRASCCCPPPSPTAPRQVGIRPLRTKRTAHATAGLAGRREQQRAAAWLALPCARTGCGGDTGSSPVRVGSQGAPTSAPGACLPEGGGSAHLAAPPQGAADAAQPLVLWPPLHTPPSQRQAPAGPEEPVTTGQRVPPPPLTTQDELATAAPATTTSSANQQQQQQQAPADTQSTPTQADTPALGDGGASSLAAAARGTLPLVASPTSGAQPAAGPWLRPAPQPIHRASSLTAGASGSWGGGSPAPADAGPGASPRQEQLGVEQPGGSATAGGVAPGGSGGTGAVPRGGSAAGLPALFLPVVLKVRWCDVPALACGDGVAQPGFCKAAPQGGRLGGCPLVTRAGAPGG